MKSLITIIFGLVLAVSVGVVRAMHADQYAWEQVGTYEFPNAIVTMVLQPCNLSSDPGNYAAIIQWLDTNHMSFACWFPHASGVAMIVFIDPNSGEVVEQEIPVNVGF